MGPSRPRDEELLARWLRGDEDAFADLVRRHEDRIFSLAHRMTGNRADALEATQETFVSLFRQATAFRGDAAFGTWLYRIGINACKDLIRRRKRFPVADEEAMEARPDSLDAPVEEIASLRADLAAALASLPDDYRVAVLMHDLGGIPYEDIASATAVPLGTVKSRISRGRGMLARILEQPAGAPSSKDQT